MSSASPRSGAASRNAWKAAATAGGACPRGASGTTRTRAGGTGARYDDPVRIRCWVRELASRRVTFGYAVEHAERGTLLATGETALLSLTHQHTLTRLPDHVRALLQPAPDPVRL